MTVKNAMNLFRDVQVAEEFRQMAAEGYLDTEITTHGCVFWKNGERHYQLSTEADKIIDGIHHLQDTGTVPLPLYSKTTIRHVPLGEKARIDREAKLALARELQTLYPLEFFALFQPFAEQDGNDVAAPLLQAMCKKTVNIFSQDMLTVVDFLIRHAYARKTLSAATYRDFQTWVEKERENFADDLIPKDVLHKTWYTLSSINPTGQLKRTTNARKEWIYHKESALLLSGHIVAPVFEKTYWYNNQTPVDHTRNRHLALCQTLQDDTYMQTISAIDALPSVINGRSFAEAQSHCEALFGTHTAIAFRYFGKLWRVR